jgi:soluble lytic murein transglycosylase-like protein
MIPKQWANQDTYAAQIEAAADQNNVPRALAYGLIALESAGFNPNAVKSEPTYYCAATGQTGDNSYGLMQVLYCTAYGMGFRGAPTDLFDIATNLQYGMALLGGLIASHGGDIDGALSEYNGGNRPALGYGTRLADGTFANQSYVDAIDTNAIYFTQYLAQRDGTAPPSTPAPGTDTTTDGLSLSTVAGAAAIGGVIWFALMKWIRG